MIRRVTQTVWAPVIPTGGWLRAMNGHPAWSRIGSGIG